MRRLGVHARGSSGNYEFAWWPANVEDIYVAMMFDQNVRAVLVTGSRDPHAHCADPYGIRLGDTLSRLIEVRGRPDDSKNLDPAGDLGIRYGPAPGVHWNFTVVGDKITQIEVSGGT